MQFTVLNTTGKSTTLEASDAVFGAKPNKTLIAQSVRVFLSNQRQGTAKTKTRAEVDRTKKKWFKQKGTGNARHGARSSNIFVGGGTGHGPTGHENWSLVMAKQMKKKAMMSALSAQKDQIIVTTVLNDIKPKTKDAVAFLKKLAPDSRKVLIVLHEDMENISRSMHNLPKVIITTVQRLNIVDVVYADAVIMTKEAVKALENRLGAAKEVEKSNDTDKAVESIKEPKALTADKPVKKTVAKTVKSTEIAEKPVKKAAVKKKVTK